MNQLPLPKGTKVRVSDGTPEPPARFTRKHASWKARNYEGYVFRHDQSGIAVGKTLDPCVVFVERPSHITVLP